MRRFLFNTLLLLELLCQGRKNTLVKFLPAVAFLALSWLLEVQRWAWCFRWQQENAAVTFSISCNTQICTSMPPQMWLGYCSPDFQLGKKKKKEKLQMPNFVGDSYHYLSVLSSLLFTTPLIFHVLFISHFLPSVRWMTILTRARWFNVLFTCHMGSSKVIHPLAFLLPEGKQWPDA